MVNKHKKMIRLKRIHKLICISILLLYLTIQSYFMLENYLFEYKRSSKLNELFSCVECFNFNDGSENTVNYMSNLKNLNPNDTLYYYAPYKWMFNNRVFQYSCHLLIKNKNIPYQIDSVIVTRYEFNENEVRNAFRCIVKSIKRGYEMQYKVSDVYTYVNNIKRIKCNISSAGLGMDIDEITIAIINLYDFKFDSVDLDGDDLSKIHFQMPRNMMNFQMPRLIYIPEKKLKHVAHCVHYSYNIAAQDMPKILNWFEYQLKFGVEKIVLYDANMHTLLHDAIYKKYKKSFIEIRPYHIHYEAICDLSRLSMYEIQDKVKYQAMRDYCENNFYNIFDNPTFSSKNRWKHQKITSNDCYSSLESIYEFVAYYDFDELILPRSFQSISGYTSKYVDYDGCSNEEDKKLCKIINTAKPSSDDSSSLTLYDYLQNLINNNFIKTHGTIQKLSSMYFTNGVYIAPNFYLDEFMNKLKMLITRNQTYFQRTVYNNNTIVKLQLKFSHHGGHYFLITPKDLDYIKMLHHMYTKLKCIYNRLNDDLDQSLDFTFKRFIFLATSRDHHMGKSIHYTDNVKAVFTHYAINVEKNTFTYEISQDSGILSHFRNDLYYLARNLISSITNLKIDYEYYMYLITHYSDLCLN